MLIGIFFLDHAMPLDKKDLFDVLPKFADIIEMKAATQAALNTQSGLGVSTASLSVGGILFPLAWIGNVLTVLLLPRDFGHTMTTCLVTLIAHVQLYLLSQL